MISLTCEKLSWFNHLHKHTQTYTHTQYTMLLSTRIAVRKVLPVNAGTHTRSCMRLCGILERMQWPMTFVNLDPGQTPHYLRHTEVTTSTVNYSNITWNHMNYNHPTTTTNTHITPNIRATPTHTFTTTSYSMPPPEPHLWWPTIPTLSLTLTLSLSLISFVIKTAIGILIAAHCGQLTCVCTPLTACLGMCVCVFILPLCLRLALIYLLVQ